MTHSAFDQFASLVAEALSSEQKHFNATVAYPLGLAAPSLDVDALSKSYGVLSPSTRADFLRRLKDLAHQCEMVAHKKLDRSNFANAVRALNAVVSAVEALQRFDEYRELDPNRRGGALPMEFQLKERFEKRSAAVRDALASDILAELAFLCRTPIDDPKTDTSVSQVEPGHSTTPRKQKRPKKEAPDWLHDASAEPPLEFYRDKTLIGFYDEIGYAIRPPNLGQATTPQAHSQYLHTIASGKNSRIFSRKTGTKKIEVFLKSRDGKLVDAAEARLLKYRKQKGKKVNATKRNPTQVKTSKRKPPAKKSR